MAAGSTGSDLCKDFSAAEDALALALCNSLFLLLAHGILLLVVPLREHLHHNMEIKSRTDRKLYVVWALRWQVP